MVKYTDKLLPKSGQISSIAKAGYKIRRPGYKLKSIAGIIFHSTANTKSSASNEASWLVNKNNDRAASYHAAVDDKEVVVVIPFSEVSYGTLSSFANWNYIQIEICESGDRSATILNAIQLAADIFMQNKWPSSPSLIKRHSDFQKKDCPRILPKMLWDRFVKDILTEVDKRRALEAALLKRENDIKQAYEFVSPYTSDDELWLSVFKGDKTPSPSQLHTLFNKLLKEENYKDTSKTLSRLYTRGFMKSLTYWENVLAGRTALVSDYLVQLVLNVKSKASC